MMKWGECVVTLLQIGPLSPHLPWGLMITTTKIPGHDSLSWLKFDPGTSQIQVRGVAACINLVAVNYVSALLLLFVEYN
jgi:hypothetical protein